MSKNSIIENPIRECSYSVSILLREQQSLIHEYNRIYSIKQKFGYIKKKGARVYEYKKKMKSDLEESMEAIYIRMMEIESAIKVLESLGH